MNYIIITYCIYLVITICLTIWVARTLFKNGKVFLVDIFHGNKELADSVNNLLLVGFYLINIGYAVYTLKVTETIADIRNVIETLSIKIGIIILILGAMHFFNLYIFFTLRKRAALKGNIRQPFPNS
jgi:predicted PurR-regulated permease PerM